jgi:toxin CptA
MAERLQLRLRPSRLLAAILGSAHAVAGAGLWLAPLPPACALAGSLALLAHLAWVLRRHALRRGAGALVELELVDDGAVFVSRRDGLRSVYRIAGSTFVSAPLVVLNLRPEAERWTRCVLIAADSVDADRFRRLRVWLAWRWRDGPQGTFLRTATWRRNDNAARR